MEILNYYIDVGININCKSQDFIEEILQLIKTMETRNRNSLKQFIGKRVGLIKTGCGQAVLLGYATIGEPIICETEEEFRALEKYHRVAAGSPYDIKKKKYCYPMISVERCVPRFIYTNNSRTWREI